MKKLSGLIWALLLSSGVYAQDLPKFSAPLPSKAKIVAMRYDGFVKWAEAHATPNEIEYDAIAHYYAGVRTQSTAPSLPSHPGLKEAISALRKWNDDYYAALYAYSGGGTMYSHAGNRSEGEIADVEAEAVDRWNAPVKPTGRLDTLSFAANHKKASIANKAEYQKLLTQEAKSLAAAQTRIAKLPVGGRTVLAKYLNRTSHRQVGRIAEQVPAAADSKA